MNRIRSFSAIFAFVFITSLPSVYAVEEVEDRYLSHYQDQLDAKQRRLQDTSQEIEILKRQLDDQREQARLQREALYKEYMEGLEFQRIELRERLGNLEEKRRLFEQELQRKQREDEVRLSDKERKVQGTILRLERLQKEVEEDKQTYELRKKQIESERRKQEAVKEVQMQNLAGGAVPMPSDKIRLTGMTGNEILGRSPLKHGFQSEEYYIEIGDVLAVDVWRVQDLSRSVTVRPDGRISFPLVGDLHVVGMSLTELRTILTQKISEYVVDPQVSISVSTFGGRKFVILGEVSGPGVYRFQQSVSLLEAVALAGGFSQQAGKGEILVIRGDIRKEPKVKVISVDMTKVWKEGMISENITVLPDDIIYVGRSYMGDYNKALKELVEPVVDNLIDFFVLRSAIRTAQQKGP